MALDAPAPTDVDLDRTWEAPVPAVPSAVRVVLVSECAAPRGEDDYGASAGSQFDATTLEAFAGAGLPCADVGELASRGVHLTVAVRHPKTGSTISAATVRDHTPVLAAELAQFPSAAAYLLMGDVAIAALNHIARAETGRRAVPAGSTYRIRGSTYTLGTVRLYPSYLQAGPAWRIEASKRQMITEDISAALTLAGILPAPIPTQPRGRR